MAATQLHRALARPDPMLTFTWEVSSIPGANPSNIDPSYIESVELPFSNIRSTGVFCGGGYNYFPEFHDTSAFSMVFYGDSEGRSLAYLWAWKQQVKSFGNGLYRLPSEFKRDFKINVHNTKGQTILAVTYKGCWPADTNTINLDQEGTSRVSISQTFSLDSMEIDNKMWPSVAK